MKMSQLLAVLGLAVSFMAFSCREYRSAPIVHNTLSRPIVVSLRYRSGVSGTFELGPGAKSFATNNDIAIDRIEILADGEVLYDFRGEELEGLRGTLPCDAPVQWEVRDEGFVPTIASVPAAPAELIAPDELEGMHHSAVTRMFEWASVESAVLYHIQLGSSVEFEPVAHEAWTRESSVRIEANDLRHLARGDVFWRVAAIDSNGMESRWSPNGRFTYR